MLPCACSARARAFPVAESVTAPASYRGLAFGAAAAVVVLDQLSKHWALSALADGPIHVAGPLDLRLVFNPGVAFGIGSGGGWTPVIVLGGLAVMALVAVLAWRADTRGRALGLGIILGGALGNQLDRALRAGNGFFGGQVVDFADLGWWPVFNLADTALWIGIGLLVLSSRGVAEQT